MEVSRIFFIFVIFCLRQPVTAVLIDCQGDITMNVCEVKTLYVLYFPEEATRSGNWSHLEYLPPTTTMPTTVQPTEPTTVKPLQNVTENAIAAPTNVTAASANVTAASANVTAASANVTAAPANATAAPADVTAAPADVTDASANVTAAPVNATAAPADVTTATIVPTIPTMAPDPRLKTLRPKELLLIVNCNTTYLPTGLGKIFPSLKSLVVWFSGLKFPNSDALGFLPMLSDVNFQDNIIEDLQENCFTYLYALTRLNIGVNKIKVLPENLFMSNLNLETFIANQNKIEVIPALLFFNKTMLSFVNLNNNRLKVVSVDFTLLTNIKKVLGLQNVCADFFLNKEVNAVQLNKLLIANCSDPKKSNNLGK